ncbi:MAG: hypothetical protein R3C01_15700 [Planctomycetaceae bacterium]
MKSNEYRRIMNPFLLYWIASTILVVAWSLFLTRMPPPRRPFPGPCGAWLATLVLTALWQAEVVPQLWAFLNVVLLVWQIALAFIVIGTIGVWRAGTSISRT